MAKKTRIKVDGKEITRLQSKPRVSDEKVEELKKLRARLYSQKSYWVKKWNEAPNKKEANRSFARAQLVQRKLNLVNKQLGVSYDLEPVSDKPFFEDGVRKKQYNVWEGIKRIREVIKKRFYTTIIIKNQAYSIKNPSQVYDAYEDLEREAYAIPRGTPMVEFSFDIKNKRVTITF